MRKLLVYMKDYKKESFLAPLFKLLEATFELIVPLVIAQIIDVGIQTGDTGFIISRCLLLVGFGVVGMVSAITAQYFAAKAAVGFATGLRHSLFQKINELSFSLLDRVGTSTLLTRITNDVNQVQNGVNLVLRLFMRSPFIVFGACVMAFTIDPGSAAAVPHCGRSALRCGIRHHAADHQALQGYPKPAGFRFEHHA